MKKRMTTHRRKQKRHTVKRSNHYPTILLISGLLLLTLWGVYRASYYRSLRLSDAILASYASVGAPEAMPVFLRTRGIKELPIVQSSKRDGRWVVAPHAANHVRGSQVPGGGGNIIIYGHNTTDILGPIRWLSVGDEITLTTANGHEYDYRVFTIREVNPTQIELLSPTNTEILTLYTCSGFFDSKRFVVRAISVQ